MLHKTNVCPFNLYGCKNKVFYWKNLTESETKTLYRTLKSLYTDKNNESLRYCQTMHKKRPKDRLLLPFQHQLVDVPISACWCSNITERMFQYQPASFLTPSKSFWKTSFYLLCRTDCFFSLPLSETHLARHFIESPLKSYHRPTDNKVWGKECLREEYIRPDPCIKKKKVTYSFG